jgi:hypothetical protein
MSSRLRLAAIQSAAFIAACAAFAATAHGSPVSGGINTFNAGRAVAADPNNAPTGSGNSVVDGAISGATRGAIAGAIAGGLAGFFGLAKKFSGKAPEEPTNEGRDGRPYF